MRCGNEVYSHRNLRISFRLFRRRLYNSARWRNVEKFKYQGLMECPPCKLQGVCKRHLCISCLCSAYLHIAMDSTGAGGDTVDPGPSTAAEVVELGSASGADSDPDTIQRPGSKKRGRKTKHIKEHFTKVGAGPVGKSKRWCYKCKYCSNEFTNSQNSALVSHILHSCTEVPASISGAGCLCLVVFCF